MLFIPAQPGLDSITVYWHNYEPGKGMVTIVCYGCAWNSYFNAMSGQTIQEFFAQVDVPYLTDNLGLTQWLKKSPPHLTYLSRLVGAVKVALWSKETV